MASKIADVEDALFAAINALFGPAIKSVDWAPPDWDEDFIKRVLIKLPAVFVIFSGGRPSSISGTQTILDSEWTFVAVSDHKQNAKARARGDTHVIGCYDILELLIPTFDGYSIAGVGTFSFVEWNNEFALKLETNALMTQSALFRLPIALGKPVDQGSLDPFKSFHDTFNVGQQSGAPTAEDSTELPQ
jgi:hypothetical protein